MPYIRCFLCAENLDQRTSDKGKPYFVCDACGVQIFIRKKQGIERLQNFVSQVQAEQVPTREELKKGAANSGEKEHPRAISRMDAEEDDFWDAFGKLLET
jgi:DNA-directed RNA polymerase subunit RPC12/RpoP